MAAPELITTTNEAFQVHLAYQKFSSFKAFETRFKEFQKDTGSVFRIKSSSSVAVENKRRKTPIPDCFKYGSILYCCVHYGKPKVQGYGVRPKQRYLPCGCRAMIALSYSMGFLVVTKSNMEHNHSLDPETALFYPSNRRLEVGQIRDVQDILTLNPSAKQVKDIVSTKHNKVVTLKDIHNLRSKFKSKSDNMHALCDLLEEIGDAHFQININCHVVTRSIWLGTLVRSLLNLLWAVGGLKVIADWSHYLWQVAHVFQWIGCETCEKWFHSCCIGVDPETTYVCSDCL